MPDPTPVEHACPVCWRPFTATNPHARYCSGACRVEDWRRRHDHTTPLAADTRATP